MKKPRFFLVSVLLLSACCAYAELKSKISPDGTIELKTARLTTTVKHARIIGLRTHKTTLAAPATPARAVTSGVGSMTGRGNELSTIHYPWGDPRVNHAVKADIQTRIYHYPTVGSKISTLPSLCRRRIVPAS